MHITDKVNILDSLTFPLFAVGIVALLWYDCHWPVCQSLHHLQILLFVFLISTFKIYTSHTCRFHRFLNVPIPFRCISLNNIANCSCQYSVVCFVHSTALELFGPASFLIASAFDNFRPAIIERVSNND